VSRIFWDTNLFIYLIEGFGDLSERVITLRKRMIERGDELYTSALTVGEILIKPLEAGDEVLARRYESVLLQGAVVIPFDLEPARL
jgi:predicted nucleic acid-binding protein